MADIAPAADMGGIQEPPGLGGELEAFEDFAAFGDFGELEHVCEMLEEAAASPPEYRHSPEYLTGEKSYLLQRLNQQARRTEEILESERPGLYRRTWMAALFWRVFVRLDEVTEFPARLKSELSDLLLDFHKVQIAAHEVFDPVSRERLISKAVEEAVEKTKTEEFSDRQKEASAARPDVQKAAAFQSWLSDKAIPPHTVNLNDIQGMPDFKPEWSQLSTDALRRRVMDAGVKLKSGRPSKKI